jgi:dolichol kinase
VGFSGSKIRGKSKEIRYMNEIEKMIMYLAALLVSTSLVSLSCTVSNSIQHCGSGIIDLKSYLFEEFFCPQRAAEKHTDHKGFLSGPLFFSLLLSVAYNFNTKKQLIAVVNVACDDENY